MRYIQDKAGGAKGAGGRRLPPQFFVKFPSFPSKSYEIAANYETFAPQILSFQYITPLILRASAGPVPVVGLLVQRILHCKFQSVPKI